MACPYCRTTNGLNPDMPCRHDKENQIPAINWQDTDPETHAFVADMQDVLSVARQRGIAQKHIRAAYRRGYFDGLFKSKPEPAAEEQADGQP